jgi:uncharacterized membrane protein
MAAGFLLGPILVQPAETRRRELIAMGAIVTAAFVVLRTINTYGNPSPWTHQGSTILTICSFLNCTKQPPSLVVLR